SRTIPSSWSSVENVSCLPLVKTSFTVSTTLLTGPRSRKSASPSAAPPASTNGSLYQRPMSPVHVEESAHHSADQADADRQLLEIRGPRVGIAGQGRDQAHHRRRSDRLDDGVDPLPKGRDRAVEGGVVGVLLGVGERVGLDADRGDVAEGLAPARELGVLRAIE